VEDHPIVAGAVGFALGAAVAAVLPSTEVENRTFGAERDRLLDEAARLLRQERERAMQIAGELGQEIKAAAQETVEAVSDTVADKASQAASRVTDRASDEIRSTSGGMSGGSGLGSSPSLAGPGDPAIG
jgi:acyl-CoA reductase-like NAD-dependent aldehyde dehydrogenase